MKSDQINELATALCAAQKQIKGAVKDANNPFFKSKYADLTSTWEACKDALTSNGLSVVQTLQTDLLETMLIHISGQWISGSCQLLNLKGDMQGLGSAISYARRYSLAAIVGVVTEDDDAESAGKSPGDIKSPQAVPTVPPPSKPGDYIPAVKKFQKSWPGKKLSEIPNGEYEILNYIDWLKREGAKFPEQKEFLKYGEAYIKEIQSKRDISEPRDVEDFDMPADKIFRK